jgi:hypothetical protein
LVCVGAKGGSPARFHSSPLHVDCSSSKLRDSSKRSPANLKGNSSQQKIKTPKHWKVKKEQRIMVVGVDVEVEAIPKLLGRTTIERFCGKIVTLQSLKAWIAQNWSTLLGYCP